MSIYLPEGYRSSLDLYETQSSISFIKRVFEEKLTKALNLKRVSAPLFVLRSSGLNDDLDGKAEAVHFTAPFINKECVIVRSLAKWKRMALYDYDFYEGNGLYTDMNAIRKDEKVDNLHSIYVDQWDWEKVISKQQRNIDYLYETVSAIHTCILETLDELKIKHPSIETQLEKELHFFDAQEVLDMYPDLSSKERENALLRKYKSVFIKGIGHKLSNGEPHDDRAADYDDWDLNGDLLYYNQLLDCAFEVSSMGIRVDEDSLIRQLKLKGEEYKLRYVYHSMIFHKELPYTIGGGIGESRLCMLLMNKAHIGEVQSSIWDEETLARCKEKEVIIL